MKKFVNRVDDVLTEALRGFGAAHGDLVAVNFDPTYVTRAKATKAGKVALISGGGSGHEPLHAGFVGAGMLDAACPGAVFTSPTPDQMAAAAQAVNSGAGVLFIVKNYEGDVMNFEMAGELLNERGIRALHLAVTDDVASAPPTERARRRGVAGDVFVLKAAGARADEGASLKEVHAAAAHANARVRTVGVALGPCTVPAAGRPTFELPEGTMDVGMGVHGEAGLARRELERADGVADELLDLVLAELQPVSSVRALVNTLGATPLMEALVVLRRVDYRLRELGIALERALIGEYVTSLEMAGLSLSLVAMDDDLRRLFDAPARALAAPSLHPSW
jgi:phosphoenolpyruvate---glycerone phosphotransferase subunit DhaK